VLPFIYFSNIVRFVEEGGAVLVAAGPAFAHPYFSLARTPLARFLPARPTGQVIEAGFRPVLTTSGFRHPVTAALPQANGPGDDAPAEWGRWFRLIENEPVTGQTLMAGAGDAPLLVLDRYGEGRVAQLMSDHSWLWTRGFEGGGPQAELLRRLAHWLMREPDLEEEDLRAEARGGRLTVRRRSMQDAVGESVIVAPSGAQSRIPMRETEPGVWTGAAQIEETGLFRVENDGLTAVAASGPVNPVEFADVIATDAVLAPVADRTGGGVFWLAEDGAEPVVPALRRVRPGRDAHGEAGRGWLGLVRRDVYEVLRLSERPAASPWAWLAALAAALGLAWRIESR